MEQERLMNSYELNNIAEVRAKTDTLDHATLCPLIIVDTGVQKPVTNFKGVYNINRGRMAASVGNNYHLVQHKEYFDTFCEALDNLGIKYTAVVNQAKNIAMMDILFVGRNIKFKELNEEFATGIRLVNSYNRLRGLCISPRYTRLACINGMVMNRWDITFSVRHNSKLVIEMERLIETKINAIINNDEELKAWVSDSMADSIEWRMAIRVLQKLIGSMRHREQILKLLGISVITKTDKRKKTISYVLDNEANKKLNRWTLYNSITQYCTHGEQITPQVNAYLQKQAERLLVTKLEKMPMAVAEVL
jgi:hypothetical protein